MGRSGKREDTESGDIFSLVPVARASRELVSQMAEGATINAMMNSDGLDTSTDQVSMPNDLKVWSLRLHDIVEG